MYQQRLPIYYTQGYPYLVQERPRLSTKEILWRLSWPYVLTLVLASLMLVFIITIFILEIASLANDSSNNLSNTASTGAGIWCAIFFLIPVVFMYLLGNLQLILNNKYLFFFVVFSACP
jgi:choline-glycine betaine transporter